jgi:hypothetical protein
VPRLETEITEITTGLGALGYDVLTALREPPPQFANVQTSNWDNLRRAYEGGGHETLFTTAWSNGRALLLAVNGLRGRLPIRVEWKGPEKQVEQDPVPADLRIDNVFLVSVKTRSSLLWNRSPAQVFLRQSQATHWYAETAPAEYQALYDAARTLDAALSDLPRDVTALTRADGARLSTYLASRQWPPSLGELYLDMAHACANRSAERWNLELPTAAQRERAAWWLLRLGPAPYFLLGDSATAPLRIRIETPWDWRQRFEFLGLEIDPALDSGQPQVNWTLRVRDRLSDEVRDTEGYVEIRWSHGRFHGHPEAKVQLRTRHELVPGYSQLS